MVATLFRPTRRLRSRHKRTKTDPATPDKFSNCSKRTFDGLIKKWRRGLHKYDPNGGELLSADEEEKAEQGHAEEHVAGDSE